MTIVSERLKQLRKEYKLSQKQVAEILGISESGYGYYEQGRNEPSIEMLNKLADRYNVTIDYLLGRTDDPTLQSSGVQEQRGEYKADFDPISEINRLLKEYGIEQMGFFDIEKWKDMTPEDIRSLEDYFNYLHNKSKNKDVKQEDHEEVDDI